MAKETVHGLQDCDASGVAMIGWQTPPLTTSFSRTSLSCDGPARQRVECSGDGDGDGDVDIDIDIDDNLFPWPAKRRKTAHLKSPPPALGSSPESYEIPDVPESDLAALQRVWWRARAVMPQDSQASGTSITSISKTFDAYTSRIFKHRSIRFRQRTNHQRLFINDVEDSGVKYEGDLVSVDESAFTAGAIDRVIRSLNFRRPNERTWEAELYYPYFCLQGAKLPVGSILDPPMAIRLLQHPMKTILRVPSMAQPDFISFPPIVSAVDRRLTMDNVSAAPPWIEPVKEGKIINDIVYAVNDNEFWSKLLNVEPRERIRARLAGYNLFSNSDNMLPYLLVENKREESAGSQGLDYAKAYLILIAASLLHQRLKLRAIGKMRTTLKTPSLVVHCITIAGTEVHYVRVGLRGPISVLSDSPEMQFVRYEGEIRGVFDLARWKQRNQFRNLLRTIHAFGLGVHHQVQTDEITRALRVLYDEADDFEPSAHSETIMSKNTAFHCIPTTEGGGDYILEFTDMTISSQAQDELDVFEDQQNPGELNTSDADTQLM